MTQKQYWPNNHLNEKLGDHPTSTPRPKAIQNKGEQCDNIYLLFIYYYLFDTKISSICITSK